MTTLITITISQKVNLNDIGVYPKEYDQDEFEGFEVKKPVQEEHVEETSTENVDESSTDEKMPLKVEKPKGPQHYYMEIGFIIFLVAYAVNFYIGANANRELIKAWGKKFQPLFIDNFAKNGNRDLFTIQKADNNTYQVVSSGRLNCFGMQVTLNLKKRQDLLYCLLDLVGYQEPDKMTIEIAVNNTMDPLIFAVIRNKALKKFKSDHQDVDLYCSKYGSTNLSNNYAVLCDTDVLPSLFLKNEVIDVLNNSESLVESILFSDHSPINEKYPKVIQGVFKFKKSEFDKLYKLGEMMMHYIDLVATTPLPKPYKQQAEKLRLKAKEQSIKQKHSERQEEAQRKKYEKLQKEKEAASKMTPEQQRKYDEKEHKRQLKKKSGKFAKVVVG